MAKARVTAMETGEDTAKPGRSDAQSPTLAITIKDLSKRAKAMLTSVRATLVGRGNFAKDLGIIREKTKDIAPKVMAFYDELVRDFGSSRVGWVGFARMIDPTVPDHPRVNKAGEEGYQAHPTYYALTYIKQRWNTQLNPDRKRGTQGKREAATDMEARLLATLLSMFKDPNVVWDAMVANFGISEKLKKNLIKRAAATEPILDVRDLLARPLNVTDKNIHMMTATNETVRNLRSRLQAVNEAGGASASRVATVRGTTRKAAAAQVRRTA